LRRDQIWDAADNSYDNDMSLFMTTGWKRKAQAKITGCK
jgi:hypothetical protein